VRPIIGRIQRGIGSQERKQGNGVRQKEAHDPAFAKSTRTVLANEGAKAAKKKR
jgi:hypothetical protein